jgi:hypothetical protein
LSEKTRKFFSQVHTPQKILELNKIADIFVAKVKDKIVGIISGVENNRVNRLFVDKKYQRQG